MQKLYPLFLCLVLLGSASLVQAQVSYTPDLALRLSLRKQVWAELKPLTPSKFRFVMGLVFKGDEYFKTYEGATQNLSYPAYEIATAQTFFEVICTEVKRGKDFSKEEIDAYYNRIRTRYEEKGIDRSLSQAALQQKYESLILRCLWLGQMNDMEKRDRSQLKKLATSMLDTFSMEHGSNASADQSKPPVEEAETVPSSSISDLRSDVDQVILRTVTSYGLGGVYIENEVNVLFRNGEMFTNPSEPLEALNLVRSKQVSPNKWDTWERRGNVLFVRRSRTGKTYEWKKWFELRPASASFRLSGTFHTADAFGGAAVVNSGTVYFDQKGRFAWKTVKGGNTTWKPVFSETSTSGTYQISQYTITLNYGNGISESFFFGLYPKDDQHFVIGSNHFTPDQD